MTCLHLRVSKYFVQKNSGFVECSLGPQHGLLLAYDCITFWGSSSASLQTSAPIRASVYGLGSNGSGQLGQLPSDCWRPKELVLPAGFIPVAIAVSANASLIVAKGGEFLLMAQGVTQRCSLSKEESHIEIIYPQSLE